MKNLFLLLNKMDVVNIQDLVPDLDKTIEKLFSRFANSLCCIVLIKIIQFIYIYMIIYILDNDNWHTGNSFVPN